MLKKIVNRSLLVVFGIVLGFGITVSAYNFYSKDVSFTPINESWAVDNVEDAINDLHDTSSSKITDLEKQLESKNTTATTLATKVSTLNSEVSTLNTDVSNLNAKKTSLQNELSSLTDATVNISFNSSLETQTFKIGFKPNYIACVTKYNASAGGGSIISIYNKDYSTANVIRAIDQTGDASDMVEPTKYSDYYTINSDGFSWNITSSGVNGSMVYCTISK